MKSSIIRTDNWKLAPIPQQLEWLEGTQSLYRAFVRALIGVVYVHYPEIAISSSPCAVVEKLIHATKANRNPRYKYFSSRFYKFPSYLRRAAIEAAIGQVSSFQTRYFSWQSGNRKRRDALPPRLTADTNIHAVLYRGQCIKFALQCQTAEIKVWNGSDWIWTKVSVIKRRQRHLVDSNKQLSPTLVVNSRECYLAVPFKIQPTRLSGQKVCAVDVGINTTATASIVSSDGTVTARKFFHRGADIDRRDKVLQQVRQKAKLTKKLHKGFCKTLYRRANGINRNMAQHISKEIVQLAVLHDASIIVFENLKGWKPKGGKKRTSLRQRFHGWLHRLLVQQTEQKFQEVGGRVEFVPPKGTSSWASDGSGKVRRDKSNYALATFGNGKQYNADLCASYNIAARYWAYKLKLAYRNGRQLSSSQSSGDKQRMPVTLSLLWDREAPHVCGAS